MNEKKALLEKKKLFQIIYRMLIIAAVILTAFLWKSTAEIPITSETDATVELTATNSQLQQSWQATSKNITGFSLQVDLEQSHDLQGDLIVSMRDGEKIIWRENICLDQMQGKDTIGAVFDLQKLELGKRYYFDLEMSKASVQTVLALKSNSDYAGLKIDGKEIPGALGGIIQFRRANNIAWILRIFIIFGGISMFWSLLFNRKFEEVLAFTVGTIFIFLYLFGIMGVLKWGILVLCITGCVLFLMVPYLMTIRNCRLNEIISPGMAAFWGLFLLYFVLDRNVVAGKVDDLNHWQLCVRDMWYSDSYPFHFNSNVFMKRYTPGFATIEYLFIYLYGAYREGFIMLACHSIGFSMLSILYAGINWKTCHKTLPVTIMIAGLPLLIYQSHYGILYVDAYLGMIGAYILICYFKEKYSRFNLIRITVATMFLVMIKEMGLVIAGTIYAIIFMDLWLRNRAICRLWADCRFRNYVKSGFVAASMFVTWQVYIVIAGKKYGYTDSFNNILSLFGIAKGRIPIEETAIQLASLNDQGIMYHAVVKAEEAAQIADATPLQTIKDMIYWFIAEREFFNQSYLGITILILILFAMIGAGGVYRRLDIPIKRIAVGLLMGTALYTCFLVLCYIFLFKEASSIPAARRYMGSYLMLFMITLCGILVVKANEAASSGMWRQQLTWGVALLMLFTIPRDHNFYTTEENFGGYFATWKNHQTIGEVFNSFADKKEKVYFVEYQNSDLVPQYDYLTFANAVVPNQTQGLWGGWKPVAGPTERYKQYTVSLGMTEWKQMLLSEYTYVYLRSVDDYFITNYGKLFADPGEIETGGIYRVYQGDTDACLKRIAYKNLE